MADNTILSPGAGGDTIRTLDKTGTGAFKTEVVAIDIGGGDGRGENILTFPIPVNLPDVPVDEDAYPVVSLSASSLDALEMLFRQLMAATASPIGIPTPPFSVTVGASSVPVIGANPNRKGMVITNTSATQVISLGLGSAAVAGAGIVLQPNNWWWMDRNGFTAGAINAVASAAGGSVAVQEFN